MQSSEGDCGGLLPIAWEIGSWEDGAARHLLSQDDEMSKVSVAREAADLFHRELFSRVVEGFGHQLITPQAYSGEVELTQIKLFYSLGASQRAVTRERDSRKEESRPRPA